MKYLPFPSINDNNILDSIARRAPLSQCPHISSDLNIIKSRYAAYHNTSGNPIVPGSPPEIILPGKLQNVLPERYRSKTDKLQYITDIRDSSPNICPMCGSPTSETVDHIFPQSPFPDFAIFSKNLVPACFKCNSSRNNNYKGNATGERVMHPYYDRCFTNRLLQTKLVPTTLSYRIPNIELEVLLQNTDPLFPTVTFHLKNVVLSAGAINYLLKLWVNFQRLYHIYFRLPNGNFTDLEFNDAVINSLNLSDQEFSTPNNWKSFLLAGLKENNNAKAYLAQTIRDIRSGVLNPNDI